MHDLDLRIANRAGLQAQDLPWHSVESEVPKRSRWPFRVKHQDQNTLPDNDSSAAPNDKPTFNFTT